MWGVVGGTTSYAKITPEFGIWKTGQWGPTGASFRCYTCDVKWMVAPVPRDPTCWSCGETILLPPPPDKHLYAEI